MGVIDNKNRVDSKGRDVTKTVRDVCETCYYAGFDKCNHVTHHAPKQ